MSVVMKKCSCCGGEFENTSENFYKEKDGLRAECKRCKDTVRDKRTIKELRASSAVKEAVKNKLLLQETLGKLEVKEREVKCAKLEAESNYKALNYSRADRKNERKRRKRAQILSVGLVIIIGVLLFI